MRMILTALLLPFGVTASAAPIAVDGSFVQAAGAAALPAPPLTAPPPVIADEAPAALVPLRRELSGPRGTREFVEAFALVRALGAKSPSVSSGSPFRRGRLRNPAELPPEGYGYRSIRYERGINYGTDSLVAGILQAVAEMQEADPAMRPLSIGDLSPQDGGKNNWHRSHQSGRDADLVYFWTDEDGLPVPADDFVRFKANGRARYKGKIVRFDTARSWTLVKKLLTSPHFGDRVQHLFVYSPLRRKLLDYASRHEDPLLVERAASLMGQPARRAGRHDDHLHIRIRCSDDDRLSGCRD